MYQVRKVSFHIFVCLSGISILPLSMIFLLDFWTVPTMWYFQVFHFILAFTLYQQHGTVSCNNWRGKTLVHVYIHTCLCVICVCFQRTLCYHHHLAICLEETKLTFLDPVLVQTLLLVHTLSKQTQVSLVKLLTSKQQHVISRQYSELERWHCSTTHMKWVGIILHCTMYIVSKYHKGPF